MLQVGGTANRNDRDECQEFVDGRYVAAFEAIWRLFTFKMHDQFHAVIRLQCHLENQQYATFRDGEPIASVLDRNEKNRTDGILYAMST